MRRLGFGQPLQDFRGAVGGAIVHDHQLAIHVFRQLGGEHQGEAPLHHRAFVVNRDQDGQEHGNHSV